MPWITASDPTASSPSVFPANSPAVTASADAGSRAPMVRGNSDGVRSNWWNPPAGVPSALPQSAVGQDGGFFGYASQLIGQMQNAVNGLMQRALASFGQAPSARSSAAAATTATYQSADLSSVGDPHLGLSGTALNADGTTKNVTSNFDSMAGHTDLLHTNDFGDRFRVRTDVTAPDANGVTFNQKASATMNGGRDSVSLASDGTVSMTSGGQTVELAAGASLVLANGATVSRGSDGSVSIAENAPNGESLTTTFSLNGNGVDVRAHAAGGVSLGGDIVSHVTG